MGISLAPEYARLLPEYQEKWLQIALSTEPIDSTQATEAVKRAYRVNGFKEPQVYLCGSPFAGLQKVVELANELGDLGKGLNQKIQLHNEWFFTHQALLSQHIGQVARPLAYLRYLFRPLENHLEENLLYRPKSEQPAYRFPQPGDSTEEMLNQYAQFMQAACAMPRSLFYNKISTHSLADNYCCWDFGFSVLNWSHNSEKWAVSETLLATCG